MPKNKVVDVEKGATLYEMFDYLCGKIPWEKTNLDNYAVACMNKLFIELRRQKTIYKG